MDQVLKFVICDCGVEPAHGRFCKEELPPSPPVASQQAGREMLAFSFFMKGITGHELAVLAEALIQSGLPEDDPLLPPMSPPTSSKRKKAGPKLQLVPTPEKQKK